MNKNFSNLNLFGLKNELVNFVNENAENMPAVSVCNSYIGNLESGISESMVCEGLVKDLTGVATDDSTKEFVRELSESIKENGRNIAIMNNIISLENGPMSYVSSVLESAAFDYLTAKNAETRASFRNEIGMFGKTAEISAINENLMYDELDERVGKELKNVAVLESETPKLYTESEVNEMLAAAKASEPEKPAERKTFAMIETHIELDNTIKNILKESSRNEKLKVFCEQYLSAMNAGQSETQLYESFISGASNWNYLSAVDTEISALKDRISKYKQDIDLKQILEIMSQTSSFYIVPLIEDCVMDYLGNRNAQNRAVLRDRLYAFEHDPYVRNIVSVITRDDSINNTVNLGEDVELANRYVNTEKIYSPVVAVKEGESAFNVKGIFYAKNGDVVRKMNRSEIASLNEGFLNVCRLMNSNAVRIDEANNTISIFDEKNEAVISESEITLNGKKITTDDLKKLNEQSRIIYNGSNDFYNNVYLLNENFNNIAYIDFGKRISSKDNSGHAVDIFRTGDKLYVNTVNENLHSSTFYSDVNPIQCRKCINEHLGINVSSMFEDIMPDQNESENEIDETKKNFESYISNLEAKLETLNSMKNEEGGDTEEIDSAIELINKELDSVKNDYKKYQDDTNAFLNGRGDDDEENLRNEILKGNDENTEDAEAPEEDKKDEETPAETSQEMQLPITGEDELGDVAEFDGVLDAPSKNAKFEIVRVSYAFNVKNNTTSNQGEVIFVNPSVDANGDTHNEMRKVTFTLDSDRTPIINNEYMDLDLYYAIKDAIENAPETATVDVSSAEAPVEVDAEIEVPAEDAAPEETQVEDSVEVESNDEVTPEEDNTEETVEVEDTPAEKPSEEVIEPAEEEAPAETASEENKPLYPINLDINLEDIKPVKECDFEKALDEMKIEHSKFEGDDCGLCIVIDNKAKAHALKNYFNEWHNFDDNAFNSFFPELQPCFCECVTEGVEIKGIQALRENGTLPDRFVFKATRDMAELFGLKESEGFVEMKFINNKERYEAYSKLRSYSVNHKLNEDAFDFVVALDKKYQNLYESEHTYSVNLPYSNILEQKLSMYNVKTSVNEGMMTLSVNEENVSDINKALKSFYGEKEMQISLNEGVHITVKDDRTGKTVEINTDELNMEPNTVNDPADFNSSFKDTTDVSAMNIEDSLAFKDDEESADDEEDKEKDKENEKNESENENKDEDAETLKTSEEAEEEKGEESEDEKEEPKKEVSKKKFKIRKRNESVETAEAPALNESLTPGVMDYVRCKDGVKGQIIGKTSATGYIVNAGGHTRLCDESDMTVVTDRADIVECPFKYDEKTLKGLFEQMVQCGLFMHNNRLTGNDCFVKFSEYSAAGDEDMINIVLEGKSTPVTKKYIRITEDIDDAMDIAKYFEGGVSRNGEIEDVLVNSDDWYDYMNSGVPTYAVRVLVFDENGDSRIEHVPASSIFVKE